MMCLDKYLSHRFEIGVSRDYRWKWHSISFTFIYCEWTQKRSRHCYSSKSTLNPSSMEIVVQRYTFMVCTSLSTQRQERSLSFALYTEQIQPHLSISHFSLAELGLRNRIYVKALAFCFCCDTNSLCPSSTISKNWPICIIKNILRKIFDIKKFYPSIIFFFL